MPEPRVVNALLGVEHARPRRRTAGLAGSPRCSSGSWGHPGPLPRDRRPGPQRPVPLVRQAGGRRARRNPAGVRTRSRLPRSPRTRPDRGRAHRGACRVPEPMVGADERLAGRHRRPGADARGADAAPLPRDPLHEVHLRAHARRPVVVADFARRAADRHVSSVGTVERAGRRPRRSRRSRRGSPTVRAEDAVVDLFLSWPTRRPTPTRARARRASRLSDLSLARDGAPGHRRRLHGRRATATARYFAFRPAPTVRARVQDRGRSTAGCTRWSASGWTSSGCSTST